MVKVNIKGIAKVTVKGRIYWYAWRGGPRLRGEPGSPKFVLPPVGASRGARDATEIRAEDSA
jgi:hypothetical protein